MIAALLIATLAADIERQIPDTATVACAALNVRERPQQDLRTDLLADGMIDVFDIICAAGSCVSMPDIVILDNENRLIVGGDESDAAISLTSVSSCTPQTPGCSEPPYVADLVVGSAFAGTEPVVIPAADPEFFCVEE